MRSSTFLAVLGAGLAIASPIVKKALVTEIETDIVYVYVTEPKPANTPVHTTIVTLEVIPTKAKAPTTSHKPHSHSHSSTPSPTPTTTSTPPPPPPPSTTQAPPPPPSTTTPPPPPPTTEAPPPPPPSTTAAPAPATTSAPAPVNNNAGGGLPSGSDFESKVIYHHNVHRQNHSAAMADYDTTMAGYAQQVASSCHYAHDLSPGGGGYGQNIAAYGATGDSGVGAAEAVAMAISDMWYDGEVNSFLPSYYGQDTPDMSNFEAWGHFSQVVWDGSTGIGCAAVLCPDGSIFNGFETWFTVCNYFPAGNMGGEYGANIHPSRGEGTVTS